jgi:23S rRNA-/tRNA-specific pseudouridylate synthase
MIKPAIMVPDKLQVLFEDNHLLVVNKPGGLLVQGDATGDRTLLDIGKAYIKQKYDKPGKVFFGHRAQNRQTSEWHCGNGPNLQGA